MTLTTSDVFVVDTHALVWYMLDDNERLTMAAREVLNGAEEGKFGVILPAIVVAEAIYVGEKYDLPVSFQHIADLIRSKPKFIVIPLDLPVLEKMAVIGTRMEMHDRIIAATAQTFGVPVITKDRAFEGVVETLW